MAIQNNTSLSLNSSQDASLMEEKLKAWIERNRAFFDVFLDAYCVVNLQHRVVEFNIAFSELCGESYRKILKIGDFSMLLNTELCPHQSPPKQILTSGKPVRIDELKASTKTFPNLEIILAGIPIYSDSEPQEILGSLLTIRNVSAESELQRKYDARKKESMTDGLTKLFNRVFTENSLLKLIKSSLRDGSALSVCMLDIDHFKKVNDTYGHQAGDYVIATVSSILAQEGRDTDVMGRYGGEEFLAVLPNCDKAGALVFAERFRKRIEKTEMVFEGRRIPVTSSVGTATFQKKWSADIQPEEEVKQLIHLADEALYKSKKNGRNQTNQAE